MQLEQDRLKTENTNLVAAFREKNRKQQQTQELYDRLKRKEMTAATQSAAYQSVDEVLGSAINHHGQGLPSGMPQYPNSGSGQVQGQQPQYSRDFSTVEQGYSHNRNGSNGSNGKERMMPPPPRPHVPGLGNSIFHSCSSITTPYLDLDRY